MFDKIIDLFMQFAEAFRVGTVVRDYEEGVVLRWGVYNRTITPGWNWLWPLYIEDSIHDGVVTRTSSTSNQALTTKDGKTIIARTMLRWRIRDIKKALLEVEALDDVTRDITYASIADAVKGATWEEIRADGFMEGVTKRARRSGLRYGIEVEQLQLTDLSLTRSFTLNQN